MSIMSKIACVFTISCHVSNTNIEMYTTNKSLIQQLAFHITRNCTYAFHGTSSLISLNSLNSKAISEKHDCDYERDVTNS